MDTNIFSIESHTQERIRMAKILGKNFLFPTIYTDSRTIKKIYNDFHCKTDFPCLYMIGQTSFENREQKYFIKVGKTTNIDKRMKTYKHSNPSLELFGLCAVARVRKYLSKSEKEWHGYFYYFGLRVGKTEWVEVSKDFYEFFKTYGFSQIKMY